MDKGDEYDLQPFEAPDLLPPIEEDEVKLVCWMVVATEESHKEEQDRPTLMLQVSVDSFNS